jgi:hypothetical protein
MVTHERGSAVTLVTTAARRLLGSDAVRRRVRGALEGQPQQREGRARHAPAKSTKLEREQAAARARQIRAEELAREANEAIRGLQQLERTTSHKVARTSAEVAELKAGVAAKQRELTERARSEALGRVEEARRRTEELSERADLHIAEVERRAEITARRIVAEAEAKLARVESEAAAEVERARIEARKLQARAEAATSEAMEATRRATVLAQGQKRRKSATDAPEVDLRPSNGSVADATAQLVRGLTRETVQRRPVARDLEAMSDVELYLLAKARGVEGRADMSRRELLAILSTTP